MRGTQAAAMRRALVDLVQAHGSDAGIEVQRVTRTGARYAADLLQGLTEGLGDGVAELVTLPDPGPGGDPALALRYDVSGYDGSDGYGT